MQDYLKSFCLQGVEETGKQLGEGSYGTVVEVRYRGLLCAAKKLHTNLPRKKGTNQELTLRFQAECSLLSQLRHPHIVQFLGVYFQSDSDVPVLVMEYVPTSLARCLDRYGMLPEEVSYSILRDVALGLAYLHGYTLPVIHRDISVTNILLTPDMTAKISDLGVARILNLDPVHVSKMTRAPGSLVYMPPEALLAKPKYNEKIDIFSFGVLMLHTLCGRWPLPTREAVDPVTLQGISEADRREDYLSDVDQDHPLLQLIVQCLSNNPIHRPGISTIVRQVAAVANHFPPSFPNKIEMLQEIKSTATEVEHSFQSTVKVKSPNATPTNSLFHPCAKLEWQHLSSSLSLILGAPQAITIDDDLYVAGYSPTPIPFSIQKFSMLSHTWSPVPHLPACNCGLGKLSGRLISISGRPVSHFDPDLPDAEVTTDVYSFHTKTQKWQKDLPSIHYPRIVPTCVSGESFVVAAGGVSGGAYLPDVTRYESTEVLERGSSQWVIVTKSLPFSSDLISGTVFKDDCFFLGGLKGFINMFLSGKSLDPAQQSSTGAFHLSLDTFRQSLHASSKKYQAISPGKWKSIPDTPLVFSLSATLGDSLLALGGNELGGQSTVEDSKKIHVYSPLTGSWLPIGSAPIPLTCEYPVSSVVAQLSRNEFAVLAMNYDKQDGYQLYKCTLKTE